MMHIGRLFFQFVLILALVSKGQTCTCSFTEIAGQKGVDSLRINSGDMTTDVTGCKTLCNTTELCIAGEFLSSTKMCYMYSLETNLTAQDDTVFFQWNSNTEKVSDDGSTRVVVIAVCVVVAVVVAAGCAVACIYFYKRPKKERKTENELQEKAKDNEDVTAEKLSLTRDK